MTIFRKYIFLVLTALFFACGQEEKVRTIPVNDFFKSQDKIFYRISPDGKNLSYLKLQDKRQNLFIEEIGTGKETQATNITERNISFYSWVSNDELIYYKEKGGAKHYSDIFIVNKDGSNERKLSDNSDYKIKVLDEQLIDGKYLLVSSNKRDSTIFDVYRLNVRDGKMEMAAKNPGNITNWITDAKGKLRLAMTSDGVNETLLYRATESQPFRPILTNNFKTTFSPIAFAEYQPNMIYVISNVNRDKSALVEVDCNTGKETKVLFSNDSLNVVEAQYSKSNKRMAFVVYETWKKEKHYLDDSVKALYEKLDHLLPQTESKILDRNKDETVFIVRTFTDRNPGSYYLYSAKNGALRKLSDFNASLKQEEMSEMKPVSFKAGDGRKIYGYLTLPLHQKSKKFPVVVLPHNGPGKRDNWGYNPEVQLLANRGYAVFQINYRGSSGYGKEFMAAGFKQWGGKIQEDIADGVKWLIEEGIADPKRIGIYGSGFGGYIALNSLYTNKGMFACAASNSGVINLFSYLKSVPPYLKANLQMFYDILGNPITDAEGMRMASPVFHADKMDAPVLIGQNKQDPRINSGETIQFVKELKKKNGNVTYLDWEGQNPANWDEDRLKFYTALEQFLEQNLKK
jgi:dipeptidyl aminopeptidase/acylaminoacyl peptidase